MDYIRVARSAVVNATLRPLTSCLAIAIQREIRKQL
jgi:hypothetical protein